MQKPVLFIEVLLLSSLLFAPLCAAQGALITILPPQTQITSTQQYGARIVRNYTIAVSLRNDGTAPSDNITVYYEDPDLHFNASLGNCTIEPGQTKTFIKSVIVATPPPFYLNVTYHPTNKSIWTTTNSGARSFTIGAIPKKSTPGFESTILALALITAGILYRKKTK